MAGNAPQGSSSEPESGVTSQAGQEKKPNINNNTEFVNLQIYYEQDGSETKFRVRRNTKLQKLLVQFCTHRSLDMKALAFLFEGTELKLEQTPQELQMEDGDVIDVMIHASGGSRMV
ncbi:putative Rad60/SUMO-like domain-containing protein [Rosa chinensis]|uniref:Putative Rad60/SUMO-like domain-containing protein n=1 Tax=Rosa chinensis TaxID=74649 RepID=A0A2P6QWD7_ROSCH|nr:small ubiquitin-related modifier 1 [Rosa chinensis]PRQ38508.1 putative Rad60/SUMO-like domain-containing protein [Rosa chinensis]